MNLLWHLYWVYLHGGAGVLHNPHLVFCHPGPITQGELPCIPVPGLK